MYEIEKKITFQHLVKKTFLSLFMERWYGRQTLFYFRVVFCVWFHWELRFLRAFVWRLTDGDDQLHWQINSHRLLFTCAAAASPSLPGLAVSRLARCFGKRSPLVTSGSSGKTGLSRWPLPGRGSRRRRPGPPRRCLEMSGWRTRRSRRRWSSSPDHWRWRWCCGSRTPDLKGKRLR